MPYIFCFLVFLSGAALASFFNLLGERLPREEKTVLSRSKCPQCGHQLNWPDLIPFFSFVFLGGKCRWCRRKISYQYLLTEIILGGLFVFIAWQSGLADFFLLGGAPWELLINGVFLWLVAGALLAVFIADLKHFIIPDSMLVFVFILTLFARLALLSLGAIGGRFILEAVLTSLVLGGIFWLVYLAGRGRWLGFGDVKLFFLAGFLLGAGNSFLMLLMASLAGSIVGVGLIIFKGKNLKTALPFGAFLAPAILFSLLFGGRIAGWYLALAGF